MAITEKDNLAAYDAVEHVIAKLSDKLEFIYVRPASTDSKRCRLPNQKFLFRTLPHALGVFAFGNVTLVCIADMTLGTFWEYVNERFGTEREPIRGLVDGAVELDSLLLEKHGLTLPNSFDIRLLYASPVDRCFESSTFAVSRAASLQDPLSRVLELQQSQSAIILNSSYEQFASDYLTVRHRMHQAGILQPGLPLLKEQSLIRLFREQRWTDSRHSSTLTAMSKQDTQRSHDYIMDVFAHCEDDHSIAQKGWDHFLERHDSSQFVELRLDCWRSSKLAVAIPSLYDAVTRFQRLVTKASTPSAIWPHRGVAEIDSRSVLLAVDAAPDFGLQAHIDDCIAAMSDDPDFAISIHLLSLDNVKHRGFKIDPLEIKMPVSEPVASNKTVDTSTRFRTASQVLNRIAHDPALNHRPYEVGFVDRFETELVWKPAEKWSGITEDDDFVPEHRIRQIRRRRGGCVVWDRTSRVDLTDQEAFDLA